MDYNEKFESIVNGSVTDPDLKSLLKSISGENDRLELIKQLLQKLTERTSQIISRQLLTSFIKDCLHFERILISDSYIYFDSIIFPKLIKGTARYKI